MIAVMRTSRVQVEQRGTRDDVVREKKMQGELEKSMFEYDNKGDGGRLDEN